MPSPVETRPPCACGHDSRDHDPWPECELCACSVYMPRDEVSHLNRWGEPPASLVDAYERVIRDAL